MKHLKKKLISNITNLVCWHPQPNYISGFNDIEIDQYTKALNINRNKLVDFWLGNFGKCSGGFLICDEFIIYRKDSLENHGNLNKSLQKQLLDEGVISRQQYDMKPYFFCNKKETKFYFIFSSIDDPFVWCFDEVTHKIYNTNMEFSEFLIDYVRSISYQRGLWFTQDEILYISSSDFFSG